MVVCQRHLYQQCRRHRGLAGARRLPQWVLQCLKGRYINGIE